MQLLVLLGSLLNVYGWGGDGHRTITSLALNMMNPRNADWISSQVEDVLRASTWADSDEAEEQYPLSGAYHFSSTPYRKCAAFDINRDCGFGKTKGLCIVTGLSEAISRAIDPNTTPAIRADSLKFILHLMADIHQPLHTGFQADSGGVRIKLSQPEGMDLHAVWDTVLVDELKKQNHVDDWRGLLSPLTSRLEFNSGMFGKRIRSQSNLTEILSAESHIVSYVAGLATETSLNTTCRSGYKGLDDKWIGVGDVLTQEYFASKAPIVLVQLLKASVRLGSLLDAIADIHYSHLASAKEERRIERIAKLFEQRPQAVESDNPFGNNPFANLAIDFDPIASEYHPVSPPIATRPKNAVRTPLRKTTNPADDLELLEKEMVSVARERASYTFFGIDLSEIVFVRRFGGSLISTKSKVADSWYLPFTFAIPIRFSGGAKVSEFMFYFDGTIFSADMNPELLIRVILKISGVDPRIDISDRKDTIQPYALFPRRRISPIVRKLKAEYVPVSKGTIRGVRALGRLIHVIHVSPTCFIFVHLLTLSNPLPRQMRFNRFFYVEKNKMVHFYVDPAIFDGDMESGDVVEALTREAVAKTPGAVNRYPNTLKLTQQVGEVHEMLLSGRNHYINGKFIDWVVDFPVEAFEVVQWFPKGTFASEKQVLEFFGMHNLTALSSSVNTTQIPTVAIPQDRTPVSLAEVIKIVTQNKSRDSSRINTTTSPVVTVIELPGVQNNSTRDDSNNSSLANGTTSSDSGPQDLPSISSLTKVEYSTTSLPSDTSVTKTLLADDVQILTVGYVSAVITLLWFLAAKSFFDF